MSARGFHVIAHRGDSHRAPENTLPAFDLAVALPAHGIETDVQVTRDGKAILFHDLSLKRTTGREAKDLVIALASHEDGLPPEKRLLAEPAIAKLVRASYLLDAFGDIGNKNQIVAAYAQFAEAEAIIQSVFPR